MSFLNALPGAVAQGIIWGLMAIGVYITYKLLDMADLTVDGSITTGAAVCAMLVIGGVNIWVAMLCALLAGMLTGLLTGLFHTFMGIPPILAGILTQLILWSVNLKIMGSKANQGLSARTYPVLVTQLERGRSILLLLAIVGVIVALLYWFFGTEIGCGIRATGCNLQMSRAQGINTDINKILGLVLSNGIVALSGALLAQYSGFADINMGRGAIVIGLAAVIIGEAIFGKLAVNFALKLLAVVGGGVIYYIVYQLVIWMGLDTDLLKMLSALVVAVFLAVPYWRGKYFSRSKEKEGK
ncbi:MAG: ABC transporter permease [Clostridia bacterium]|nr:ABC transporter permease [Clostridia bacterium]